jgi:hypothetical protein
VNLAGTASFTLYPGDRNEVRKAFVKAGSALSFDIPGLSVHDAFISTQTPVMYFALLCRVFDPDVDLAKYRTAPKVPYRLERNDGTPLTPEDFKDVWSFVVLHGSWGRPTAANLEGKLVESGLCPACVVDFRNYCHGRFIFTSARPGPRGGPRRAADPQLLPGQGLEQEGVEVGGLWRNRFRARQRYSGTAGSCPRSAR